MRVAMAVWTGFLLVFVACDATAARRSIRVDGFGDSWEEHSLGSKACAGTSPVSAIVERLGITFSGYNDDTYLFDTFCQVTVPGVWDGDDIYQPDEDGLSSLVGENLDGSIRGTRYSFFDRDRFDFDPQPQGFQWAFYDFPNGVTIVALYGLVDVPLTQASFIRDGNAVLWRGDLDGYDGEYFCFRNSIYLGTWDGDPAQSGSACMAPFAEVFADGFE